MNSRRRRSRTVRSFLGMAVGTLLCGTIGLPPAEVAAQEATFTGTWYHQRGAAERTRHEAIDRATEDTGALVRGRARERLREATTPASELTVTEEGNRVTIAARGRRVTLTTDGSPIAVSDERGSGVMQAHRKNGQLVVTVRAGSGVRTTVYRLFDDGRRLNLDVQMTAERLPEPLRYSATYIRR